MRSERLHRLAIRLLMLLAPVFPVVSLGISDPSSLLCLDEADRELPYEEVQREVAAKLSNASEVVVCALERYDDERRVVEVALSTSGAGTSINPDDSGPTMIELGRFFKVYKAVKKNDEWKLSNTYPVHMERAPGYTQVNENLSHIAFSILKTTPDQLRYYVLESAGR